LPCLPNYAPRVSLLSLALLLVLTPPPPTSPLFPYTTLFRSTDPTPTTTAWQRASRAGGTRSRCRTSRSARTASEELMEASEKGVDRKSTRLNSSHGSISYAVFCLKKKKRSQKWIT